LGKGGCYAVQQSYENWRGVGAPCGWITFKRRGFTASRHKAVVASRKLAVVRAVLYQLRSQEEVLETYSISEEEFYDWVRCLAANGPSGLKITSRSSISR
jgi:hypothetical protein